MRQKIIIERLSNFFQSKKSKEREKAKNNKEWRDKYDHIDPKLLKLNSKRLPSELLKFSKEWPTYFNKDEHINPLIKRSSDGSIPINSINNRHIEVCKYDLDRHYFEATENDLPIKFANEKLLFLFFDPSGHELQESCWFSFKDKLVYSWYSQDGYNGFFDWKNIKKLMIKPLPYKQWLQQWFKNRK